MFVRSSLNSSSSEMGDSNDLVRLNVGGVWYTTTESTLRAYPMSIFPKMIRDRPNVQPNSNNNKNTKSKLHGENGYYFIDRDGELFRYILNFLRTAEINLPKNFQEHDQLMSEAKFYSLQPMVNLLKAREMRENDNKNKKEVSMVEVIETCHPEKIGICGARIVISEELREKAMFGDVIERLPKIRDESRGMNGRLWLRTNITRLDWAEKLTKEGWVYMGTTSVARRLPDITGRGTDLCHMVDKWCLIEWYITGLTLILYVTGLSYSCLL